MIVIDGRFGEGGGQIVRTALSLSLFRGKPFCIEHIREGREKPGLRPQHVAAVNAAAQIGQAETEGAIPGSQLLTFTPAKVVAGEYVFRVGTAGSATLVCQTVLPLLMVAADKSRLIFEGGTHSAFDPTFERLKHSYLPLINKLGPNVTATLERYGFYPLGGGRFNISIEPIKSLRRLELPEHTEIYAQTARAMVVNLPVKIAEREIDIIRQRMGWTDDQLSIEESNNGDGTGNVLTIEITGRHITETFVGVSELGENPEALAGQVIDEAQRYIRSGAPVGEFLADQLQRCSCGCDPVAAMLEPAADV